jgi:hypothetical protein
MPPRLRIFIYLFYYIITARPVMNFFAGALAQFIWWSDNSKIKSSVLGYRLLQHPFSDFFRIEVLLR